MIEVFANHLMHAFPSESISIRAIRMKHYTGTVFRMQLKTGGRHLELSRIVPHMDADEPAFVIHHARCATDQFLRETA